MNLVKRFISVLALLTLAACGGGGNGAGEPPFGGPDGGGGGNGGGGGGGTPTPTAPVLAMAVQLLNSRGEATTTVTVGQPLRARAVLTLDGVAQADQIVSFTLDQPTDLVRIDPATGSVLTNSGGEAAVTVSALGTATGAGRVEASASLEIGTGAAKTTLTTTGAANFFTSGTGTAPPSELTLGQLEISSATVSAYGTTGVRVRVLQGTAPFTSPATVNFTTSCPAGKATISSPATTQADGFAVATFTDNGCAARADTTVTVTASIATDSSSDTMVVRSPTTGSLRFLSVVPADKSITLRGQGGNGRQENATVTFKLVDVAGQGVGDADVCFDVTTYLGGLNIDGFSPSKLPASQGSTALCGSDNLSQVKYVKRTGPDGSVNVQINSGTVPTPVRLRARTLYPSTATVPLETFSDTLSISTGLPLQRSFSLSIDQANIDGRDFDGIPAVITARLADQFSNPVPDGTVVNFVASGGAVCTADNGSCKTTNGACSCTFVSQERRPVDGRVIVTAYAVGLEDFDDNDGDNAFTPYPSATAPQLCSAGSRNRSKDCLYDLGDAFVDANKDGAADSRTINDDTDILIPYQLNDRFKASGDGVRGTAHIRRSTVIYLSSASSVGQPTLVVPNTVLSEQNSLTEPDTAQDRFLRLRPNCPSGSTLPQTTFGFFMEDGFGNPMAAGTEVAAVDETNNVAPDEPRPNRVLTIGARPPSPGIDLPNVPKEEWSTTDAAGAIVTGHAVPVRGVSEKCNGEAGFGVEVKSPRGAPSLAAILYEGEDRSEARFSVDVRYRDFVSFSIVEKVATPATIELSPEYWVGKVGSTATGYEIDWGDDSTPSTGSLSPMVPMPASLSHPYDPALKGTTVTVRLTIITSDGNVNDTRSITLAPP
jgi:hypothetical protein